ncbi:MAG: ATP-binding cassette domain-containing protein [Tannerella sp.]|nr:ATP-binding cassette domain-containing protein [Tannerella sp.]
MSITVKSLSYIHPDGEFLFRNISFSIVKGQKAALVGNNGAGKSTLLRIVAGHLAPSEGERILSAKPYYVPQHLGQYDEYTLSQVLGVDGKLRALHDILDGDASPVNFDRLNDDWEIEERINAAFSYWNIRHLELSQRMQSLSGGEKTKVFLAGLRIDSPDIILLDEPTNHLDTDSREALYDFVRKSQNALLVVSHDRTLLNRLDTTLELDQHSIATYGGNYDFFRAQKEEKSLALQAQLHEKEKRLRQAQQKARDVAEQRRKQEARGKSQQPKMGLARIVAGNLKRKAEQSSAGLKDVQDEKLDSLSADLMQIRQHVREQQVLKIDLQPSGLHRDKILVDAGALNFSYGKGLLWPSPLTFQIRSGDRIRIEGANGAGKTTLIGMITGKLQPVAGELFIADARSLCLDQEYTVIERQLSVFEQVRKHNGRHLPEHELKTLLHRHQLPCDAWNRMCDRLSGGEKMKLAFCCLAVSNNRPDMLILDEPTNNLDLASLEILTEAVRGFEGSVLVISHDACFIRDIGVNKHIVLKQV